MPLARFLEFQAKEGEYCKRNFERVYDCNGGNELEETRLSLTKVFRPPELNSETRNAVETVRQLKF